MKGKKVKLDRQEIWKKHVKSFQKSGLTQRDYCKQNNISYWSFNPWKRRIETSGSIEMHQIPAEIIQDQPPVNKNVEIIVHDRLRITIPYEILEITLKMILRVLGLSNENKLV